MKPGTIAALVEDYSGVKFINFSLSNSRVDEIRHYGEKMREEDEEDLEHHGMYGDSDEY